VVTCDLGEISDEFSAIVMLDVAEHLARPVEAFAACYSLVQDGGYIYIHTPRRCFWDSMAVLAARLPLFRRAAVVWLRTRLSAAHLQLWSDQALRLSLNRVGFRVCYLKREMELSWKVEQYTEIFLGEHFHFPKVVISLATVIANILVVRMGTLRNKAICLARK